jgi:hypothetical protein
MFEIITCPSGLSGRIRGMKVREERILADRKLANNGGQVNELLGACWEETLGPGAEPKRRNRPNLSQKSSILDAPAPRLLAYTRYTMVAEKLEAMVRPGMANSRMKVFYDTWLLSRLFEFDGQMLSEAMRNIFRRRSTLLPDKVPMASTDEFREDTQKQTQWRAFVRKSKPEGVSQDINAVIGEVATFSMPVLEAARSEKLFELAWPPGGQWGAASQPMTEETERGIR